MDSFPFRPPARLTLAADARLNPEAPTPEHVWTLFAASGSPPALSLESSYGLQIQSIRIFPYMELDEQVRADPATFAAPPLLTDFAPSYAKTECEPFAGLRLVCEYFIGHPRGVMGRLYLQNRSPNEMRGVLGLAAILHPLAEENAQPLAPEETAAIHILRGKAGGLAPVLFMTGGAEGALSPFVSLRLDFDLKAGGERRVSWAHTAVEDADEGLDLARRLAARKWEPLLARLAVASEPLVALETKSPQKTWTFARARQTALRLVLPNRPNRPFLVTSRLPDRPALAASAADGQTPSVLEAWYLATAFFLPTAPAAPRAWVDAFLAAQHEDGFIPWRPWSAESRYLASPLLVELAYRAYRNAPADLPRLYQPLLRFVEAWFNLGDANGDGFPEWAHPLQMGLADPPAFAPWRKESVGGDFATVESPALYAFLYRAITRLEQIAAEAEETLPREMATRKRRLHKAVQEMWDARRRAVLYRDFATHKRHEHAVLGKSRGDQPLELNAAFSPPVRPLIHIFPKNGEIRPAEIILRGLDGRGRAVTETLRGGKIAWFEGRGVATAANVYRRLDAVEIRGLRAEDRFVALTTDLFSPDISLLLPFWAGMLGGEQTEAMRRVLTSERDYGRQYGAPISPRGGKNAPDWMRAVLMPWNAFAVEAMLEQGFIADAAALLSAAARAAEERLAADGVFWEAYHAEHGRGLGVPEHLSGLPAPALMLAAAGIQPISPQQVRFTWPSPFQDELRFSFWHWSVIRSPERTVLLLPDGSEHPITTPEPFEVTLR